MQNNTDEVYQIDELMQLIAEQKQDYLSYEFDELSDPIKSFRWEFAHESVTETNSRFKRRASF